MKRRPLVLFFLILQFSLIRAQQVYTKDLMKADKLFIKKQYELAAGLYIRYLEKFPRDYFASKQAAICLDYLNDHYTAAEHWAAVPESSDCTELDLLMYARCLIQNDRPTAAAKIFPLLSKSKNTYCSSWGKAWISPQHFYADSSRYRISAAKNLNTDRNEACPFVSNGKLIYTSENAGNARVYTPGPENENRMLSAVNVVDTLFFRPSDMFKSIEKIPVFGQIAFSADGQEMYFTRALSNTEAGLKSPYSFSRYQIFIMTLSSLNASKPVIRPFSFNNSLYNYLHPCISEDGRFLFFASDMKGSSGGTDLYYSENINGEWTAPVNAGSQINSPGNELHPHLQGSGKLYFTSDGLPGMGGLDLFVSDWNGDKFEGTKNLGYPLNSRYDDFCIFFTEKNKGYLSSNRLAGTNDDLLYFSIGDYD